MKKSAFTLAEVLITLGIIGVVAALTMPALISNYRKNVVETKLKKIYSVMNQAIERNIAEYGDYSAWYLDCRDAATPNRCTMDESYEWIQQHFAPYLNTVKIEKYVDSTATADAQNCIDFYFADGSILRMRSYIQDADFYLDKKAMNNPQKGINMFGFNFMPLRTDAELSEYTYGKGFEPYAWGWDGTRTGLFTGSTGNRGCNQTARLFCGKLIQYEGWKIPDDYLLKF